MCAHTSMLLSVYGHGAPLKPTKQYQWPRRNCQRLTRTQCGGGGGGVCLVAILPFYCSNESCWEGQSTLQLCDLAKLQRMDRLGTLPTSARAYAELDVNSAHTHTHTHIYTHTDTGSVHVNVLFSDAGAK